MNKLYLVKQKLHLMHKIQTKSILLDFIERYKTKERLERATGWTNDQISRLVDSLFLKFRKFYNVADIQSFEQLEHIHYIHMYQEVNVCATCYQIYNKINSLRLEVLNSQNPWSNSQGEEIIHELNRYRMEIGSPIGPSFEEKQIFSQDFINKLRFFDCQEKFKEDNEIPIHPDLLNSHENLL